MKSVNIEKAVEISRQWDDLNKLMSQINDSKDLIHEKVLIRVNSVNRYRRDESIESTNQFEFQFNQVLMINYLNCIALDLKEQAEAIGLELN